MKARHRNNISVYIWDDMTQSMGYIHVPYEWLCSNPEVLEPNEFDYFVW